jgi:hypothetical protein
LLFVDCLQKLGEVIRPSKSQILSSLAGQLIHFRVFLSTSLSKGSLPFYYSMKMSYLSIAKNTKIARQDLAIFTFIRVSRV